MRKLILCAAALCLAAAAFPAPQAALVDSLAFLSRSPQYADLLEGLWNMESPEVCQNLYDAVQESLAGRPWRANGAGARGAGKEDGDILGQERDMDQTERAEAGCLSMKADLAIARYWVYGPEKNVKKAKACLRSAEEKIEGLDKRFESVRLVCLAEVRGIEYMISPLAIGKGLEAKRLTERARKEHPNEVSAVLMYANSKLYAPAFAGRNVDEALRLFEDLLRFPSLALWDRFSALSGLGMCLKRKGRADEARSRLREAMAIYHGDSVIIKALGELGNN